MAKSSNIHANGAPEVKQRVNSTETILEEIISQNF